MKKIFLALCIVASTFGFSQEKEQVNFKKNELKGNALLVLAGTLEVTYEHLINEKSGIGVSLFVPFSSEADINYSVSTFYRFYLGKKPAAGFFVEGFGMLDDYTQPEQSGMTFFSNYNGPEKDVTDFALGIGLGTKWITRKGFVFEINGGVGKNLFNSDDTDYQIMLRGGFSIGYRL